MRLANEERAQLIAELLDSLKPPETRSNEDWIAEVERRARDALAGSAGISWKRARDPVTERLARK
jgi:putative addiction module component (TIGR02574 family)